VAPRRLDSFEPKRKETSSEVCAVADSNLATSETAILALTPPASGPPRATWNHRARPLRLDTITRRFGLEPDELAQLSRNGFVVADRLQEPSYGWAYHEIYQSQLPVFVSVDSIFDSVYATHDHLVAQLERRVERGRELASLASLHCALPEAAAHYPPGTAHDLDVYLTVARSLLADRSVPSALRDASVEREAADLYERARRGSGMSAVELFGRPRVIDFSQFTPRGHYTGDLASYFRAAMWLERLEFNLVSRSSRSSAPGPEPDPRETPREDVDALALAELATTAGADAMLDRFEQVYGWLAGRREDVPPRVLIRLADKAGITDLRAADVPDRLRAAIGDDFQRTAAIHSMPQGTSVLPAIATLLGPRIVPDTRAIANLANIPGRPDVGAADLAYILGNERAKDHLKSDLERYPELGDQLALARQQIAAARRDGDLYTAWLDALRALAVPLPGTVPSFMDGAPFADLRLGSTIVGYAQLRHDHVLIAGQAYGQGGCQIPDGYVEPAPAVYDALAHYAELGATHLASFEPEHRAYFERLRTIARVLAMISRFELANRPLPPEAQQFLAMIVEILPFGSDGRPTYTGWFFDLFEDRADAIAHADLIADYLTAPSAGHIDYVGALAPRLGVFIVDTGGEPRAMVGPVAQGY
jgi:hypothetical protein